MPKNKEVDAWLKSYENPMKAVVVKIREIVLAADSRMGECIKWQAPTFTYLGNMASFFPKRKAHASLMFHTGAAIPGSHPRLVGEGGTSRVLKIASVAEASAAKRDIERIVKAWCDSRDAAKKPAASKPKAATTKSKRVAAKGVSTRKTPAKPKKTAKRRSAK